MGLKILAVTAAAAACLVATLPAQAAILGYHPDADVTSGPYTFDATSGSDLTFDSNTNAFYGSIGVSTTGTTEVFSFFGSPVGFQPFATNAFPSDQLGSFQAYPTTTGISYSVVPETIGFEFSQSDGIHYGLAKIGGEIIDSIYVDTTAGQNISLGVPEPSTWAFMIAGIAGIGLMLRRVKQSMGFRFKDAFSA